MRYRNTLYMILGAVLLGGCSSVPEIIYDPPTEDLVLSQAKANPNGTIGKRVRWGGSIVSVENTEDETWIEVLDRKLYGDGFPKANSASSGRFLIRAGGFLDPQVYARGRMITVVGVLGPTKDKNIGKAKYQYPVVVNFEHHLWDKEYDYYYSSYNPYMRHEFGPRY